MDQIRPVLTPLAEVAPRESDHLVIVEGDHQPIAVPPGVALEEVRAPRGVVREVTEDPVVAGPDSGCERKSIARGKQSDPRPWVRHRGFAR